MRISPEACRCQARHDVREELEPDVAAERHERGIAVVRTLRVAVRVWRDALRSSEARYDVAGRES